jgi:FixJ family two-component response regulator
MLALDIWKEMTGLELQEKLRANSPHTRPIVMTRRVLRTITNRGLKGGAVTIFVKPCDNQQFLATVRQALAAGDPAKRLGNR